MVDPRCKSCDGTGWVCEFHKDRPWGESPRACDCGGAGAPCPACNDPEDGEQPDVAGVFEDVTHMADKSIN